MEREEGYSMAGMRSEVGEVMHLVNLDRPSMAYAGDLFAPVSNSEHDPRSHAAPTPLVLPCLPVTLAAACGPCYSFR